jgi:hypothetical protein
MVGLGHRVEALWHMYGDILLPLSSHLALHFPSWVFLFSGDFSIHTPCFCREAEPCQT